LGGYHRSDLVGGVLVERGRKKVRISYSGIRGGEAFISPELAATFQARGKEGHAERREACDGGGQALEGGIWVPLK